MSSKTPSYLLEALAEYKPADRYTIEPCPDGSGQLESLLKNLPCGTNYVVGKDGRLDKVVIYAEREPFAENLRQWLASNSLSQPWEIRRSPRVFPWNKSGCWHIWDEVEAVANKSRENFPEYLANPPKGVAISPERG